MPVSPSRAADTRPVPEQNFDGSSTDSKSNASTPEGSPPSSLSAMRRASVCAQAFGSPYPTISTRLGARAQASTLGTIIPKAPNHFRNASDPSPVNFAELVSSGSATPVGSPPLGTNLPRINISGARELASGDATTPGGTIISDETKQKIKNAVVSGVSAVTPKPGKSEQNTPSRTTSISNETKPVRLDFEKIQVSDYFDESNEINEDKISVLALTIAHKIQNYHAPGFSSNQERLVLVASFNEQSNPSDNLVEQADKTQKFQVGLKDGLEVLNIILGSIKVTKQELKSQELLSAIKDSVANQNDSSLDNASPTKNLVHLIMPNIMLEPELTCSTIIAGLNEAYKPDFVPTKSEEFTLKKILSVSPTDNSDEAQGLRATREVLTQRAENFCKNRLVIKLGSRVLAENNLRGLISACARISKVVELIVVASGADLHGKELRTKLGAAVQLANLGKPSRVAIGQPKLDQLLSEFGANENQSSKQLLLNPNHLANVELRSKINKFINSIIREGGIPYINGNDATGLPGSNDEIAILIANLVGANVILTTDTDGMYRNYGKEDQQLFRQISVADAKASGCAEDSKTGDGTGGFITKVEAADGRQAPPPFDVVYIAKGDINKDSNEVSRIEELAKAIVNLMKVLNSENPSEADINLARTHLSKIPHTAIHKNAVETQYYEKV